MQIQFLPSVVHTQLRCWVGYVVKKPNFRQPFANCWWDPLVGERVARGWRSAVGTGALARTCFAQL